MPARLAPRPLPAAPSPAAVFAAVRARPGAVWLDGGTARQGWSVLAWDPVEVITEAADWPTAGRSLVRPSHDPVDLPFVGGCIGMIGYGAGHAVEAVPPEPRAWEPPVHLGRYEGGLCYRHADQTWHPTGAARWQRQAREVLARAVPIAAVPGPCATTAHTVSQRSYEDAVRAVKRLIRDGDVYQINLTRPVLVPDAGDPWDAWLRLRTQSAPTRGAWLTLPGGVCVLSNSPEVFLDVDGRQVRTVPIKGTRPRAGEPLRDAALAEDLQVSEKDRAELTMIVDLCRNDLGRVATPGSVRTAPRHIDAHANVHHASQVVSAELAAGRDAWHALAATFPPGSVTGAPKVRATQRIRTLESGPRGAYCGAIGLVSDHGQARFSVAIRTAVFQGTNARYHVGGGIVADSDPAAEWAETVDKGTALAAALLTEPSRPCRGLDEAPPAFGPWVPAGR